MRTAEAVAVGGSVPRALVCAPLMPEHDKEGGSRYIFNLITVLRSAGWAVTFMAENPSNAQRYGRELQQRGVQVHGGFDDRADEVIVANDFDIALFAFWYMAEQFAPRVRALSPRTRILVETIDVHFLRHARGVFGSRGTLGAGGLDDMARELNTYADADAVLAVSQKEADLVNDLVGDPTLAHVVAHADRFPPSPFGYEDRRGIVFIGNFRHPPNEQAATWLCEEVVPRLDPALLDEHPISIVGNGLHDRLRASAARHRGVRAVGWVPSTRPYLERARVSAVPLLYGAGVKNKLIDALATGTPTVTTSPGAEGLGLRTGKHVFIADGADAFARSLTRLIRERRTWERIAREGRAHIARLHGDEHAREQLLSVISAARGRPRANGAGSAGNAYGDLVRRVQVAVEQHVPPHARLVVVSKGDDELLQLAGREAHHFPSTDAGSYAGHHPADGADALAQLHRHRQLGATHLVLPATAFWWLEHYAELREHLEGQCRRLYDADDTCRIYALPWTDHQSPWEDM
ncbi:MAG: hypothetical protein JWN29_3069 [Acidimicrobiales bacterium]|nr:hypothetical protein [Acidimicrobiales bacterium]